MMINLPTQSTMDLTGQAILDRKTSKGKKKEKSYYHGLGLGVK